MSWRFVPELLDSYIAPGISTFTEANIPDLSGRFPQAKYWLSRYFQNNVWGGSFPEPMRQYVLGFLRRAHLVHTAYLDARRLTLQYLEGNDIHNPSVAKYYDAIARWEQFAIEASIAMDIWRWMNDEKGDFKKNDGVKKFYEWINDDQGFSTVKDGPNEYRLHRIANRVKHAGEDIHEARKVKQVGEGIFAGKDTINYTVSLWLTNAGLHSIEASVTYDEASKVAVEVAETADQLLD